VAIEPMLARILTAVSFDAVSISQKSAMFQAHEAAIPE
jgi:hypothetical protein